MKNNKNEKNQKRVAALSIFALLLSLVFILNGFTVEKAEAGVLSCDLYAGSDLTDILSEDFAAPYIQSYNNKDEDIGETLLIPGGMTFGVKIQTDGVKVVGLSEFRSGGNKCRPAFESGLKEFDTIKKINGTAVMGSRDAVSRIENSGGNSIEFTVLRKDAEMTVTITPKKDDADGKYKVGIWIKDSSAGIGTVTYICPDSGIFGGLGHGICDAGNGELIPISQGSISEVKINGIIKGEVGKPGEIRGQICPDKKGCLISNTDCGTFGLFDKIPKDCVREAMPAAHKNEVCAGKATILSTLEDGKTNEYEIEIFDISNSNRKTKNFMVKVTDERLLSKTGGIVQGMSGSPILQNGKIVGAVTHVLINDPTLGYGIFIENMLENTPKSLQ